MFFSFPYNLGALRGNRRDYRTGTIIYLVEHAGVLTVDGLSRVVCEDPVHELDDEVGALLLVCCGLLAPFLLAQDTPDREEGVI